MLTSQQIDYIVKKLNAAQCLGQESEMLESVKKVLAEMIQINNQKVIAEINKQEKTGTDGE